MKLPGWCFKVVVIPLPDGEVSSSVELRWFTPVLISVLAAWSIWKKMEWRWG